jgi:CubicO group peptidase (beta-lactamase class C family)
MISRREFGVLGGGAAAGLAVAGCSRGGTAVPAAARAAGRTWRVTGQALAGLGSFDATVKKFMQERGIQAGSLAVTRRGRLVLARGYTWSADPRLTVQPTSLFRIASLSKPITATAVLRLVQEGRLKLTDRLTSLLPLTPPPSESADPRLKDITVLRLLQHLGGWDRAHTADPMFSDQAVAARLKTALPVSQAEIMRYTTGLALDHAPGTAYAYSNYGYLLLGRIIERTTGQKYQAYVQQKVLGPRGIKRMRQGHGLSAASGEVPYVSRYSGPTVYDNSGRTVAAPYGAFNLENMDSHGGWLATAVDLTRFAGIYDGNTSVLSRASVARAFAKPETGVQTGGWWYGCGWQVRNVTGGSNQWHTGSLPGTSTLLVRRFDGLTWSILFDQRDDAGDPNGVHYEDIDPLLHGAADAVRTWPSGDLTGRYF